MQTGTLQIHVYTSRADLPLSGAAVAVTRREEDGRQILISIQTTDSSGNTAPITVAAPPRADSLSPGAAQTGALVDISAQIPRYGRVVIRNAQIFSGVASLQAIRMTPLSAEEAENEPAEEYVIPPQML